MNDDIYGHLLSGLPDGLTVEAVSLGRSWTAARLSDGGVGMAAHFAGNAKGDISKLAGKPVRDAAALIMSADDEAAGAGLAVANACYNSVSRVEALNCGVSYETLCTDGMDLRGVRVGVIGRMRRTAEKLRGAEEVFVFELDARDGEIPASEEPRLLPECGVVIATGTALMNHTLPDILAWAPGAQVVLLGPSVPLCPGIPGISRLSGFVLTDRDGFWRWNTESGGSPMAFCRPYLLK
jgi:uncharacterized protein (DUF4213/DUF364 family)